MTILFVLHYSGYYGANKSLLALMSLLRSHYSIDPIVLLPDKGVVCDELEKAGIQYEVFHYYWWVNYNHGVYQWLLNKRKQLINWGRVNSICSLFQDKTIDLVYTNSICVNMGYLIAKHLRLPHIWHARESLIQFTLSLSLSRSLAIWTSPVNKKYILISDYMMDYYKKYLPSNRMVKIYNGITLPDGVNRVNKNNLIKSLQICCVGVLCEQKNQLELLKAQSILLKRNVIVDVWLIGSGEPDYSKKLCDYVRHQSMERFVHIVGHSDNVFQMLQEMNLGVVTAHDEAFGRVTVEYMLMRMPVIASLSGANAELIEHGVSGEIYPLGNPIALADAIEHYVDAPELLEIHGNAGELIAKEYFSAEKNAELVYQQIRNVTC